MIGRRIEQIVNVIIRCIIKIIIFFLRLRFNNPSQKPIFKCLENTAIIRELHVLGVMTPTGQQDKLKYQHFGIGKKLIKLAEKKAIEDAKTDVTEAVKSDDAEKIKTAVAKLTEVSMKLGEAVYKQAQQEQKPAEESSDSKDENVVDAEFEEVKKDKPEDKKE